MPLATLIRKTIKSLRAKYNIQLGPETNVSYCALSLVSEETGEIVMDATGLAKGDAEAQGVARTFMGVPTPDEVIEQASPQLRFTPLITDRLSDLSGPVSIVLAGDSMADFKRADIAAGFRSDIGLAGVGFSYLESGAVLAGSAAVVNDATISPTCAYFSVPVGGTVVLSDNTAFVPGDTVDIAFVKESGAASIKVEVSLDGSSWTEIIASTSAANATQIGAVISGTMTAGSYYVRVTGTGSGSAVKVVGATVRFAASKGLLLLVFAKGSTTFPQWVTILPAILGPILSFYQPRGVLFETRAGSSSVSTYMATYHALLNAAAGYTMDLIIMGPPPYPASGDEEDVLEARRLLREYAATYNAPFFDQYRLFEKITVANGGSDGVHLGPSARALSVALLREFLAWGKVPARTPVLAHPFNGQVVVQTQDGKGNVTLAIQSAPGTFSKFAFEDLAGNVIGGLYSTPTGGDMRVSGGFVAAEFFPDHTRSGYLSATKGILFPTTDPHLPGWWWDNGTTLVRSAG